MYRLDYSILVSVDNSSCISDSLRPLIRCRSRENAATAVNFLLACLSVDTHTQVYDSSVCTQVGKRWSTIIQRDLLETILSQRCYWCFRFSTKVFVGRFLYFGFASKGVFVLRFVLLMQKIYMTSQLHVPSGAFVGQIVLNFRMTPGSIGPLSSPTCSGRQW